MSEPRQPQDPLELKKRARRRLVGAVAFATLAAVVLPMVMDEAPPPAGHDIELRIPGQEQLTSSPLTGSKTGAAKAPAAAAVAPVAPVASPPPTPAPAAIPPAVAAPAASAAPVRKPEVAPAVKSEPPPAAKPVASKPAVEAAKAPPPKPPGSVDAQRAQAILEGQSAAAAGPHVVLIGAFANVGNVKILQGKLGELGIKTYTENLETQQGRKIRVRAGPFPNREAAEKALEKMRRIGVGGVVAAKS